MENKYYKPQLEEFHLGFEYDILVGEEWVKKVFTIKSPCLTDGINFSEYLTNEKLRVKYLDREDIESLGFVYKGSYDDYLEFSKNVNKDLTWELLLFDDHVIHLTLTSDELMMLGDYGEDGMIQHISVLIKNKSELIKLLKAIQIDE
jgi:hypothetical protein